VPLSFTPITVIRLIFSPFRPHRKTLASGNDNLTRSPDGEKRDRAKRACIVRYNYYPQDMLVCREAMALRDYGFDVEVFCLRGKGQAASEVIDGIYVRRLPLTRIKGGIGRYLYKYLAFFALVALTLTARHLRRFYTFIQVNSMPDFLVFATLIPRVLGAKIVLQMYEPMPELWVTRLGLTEERDLKSAPFWQLALPSMLRWVEQASLRYAHAVFTVTQQLKDNFVSHGADPGKITVVLNVPDPRLFESETEETNLGRQPAPADGRFTLICHGAIEERYGHDTMLQAVAAVKSSIPGLQLRITGNGSYRDEFLAQMESLGLQDHVHYLGYVPLSQLVTELSRADIGIVAQKASPYSHLVHTGKMYDYLAFGKPVIASRLRAVQAYFDEDSLRFFEPGNAEDLSEAILDLYQHPNKRLRLARNASLLYERYKWEHQRTAYQAVCRSLVGLGSPVSVR
jgi:glycosyltransferase involved in cell wall biosynthesis